ncbi:MAG TPA: carboxypeptidase-like regulatory domain-containing protein, partial [Planctomycetota bacterium]|nr:carboxypeptidase-like regulatory domain-containing protein [Planctomycetota bacterium]
MERTLTFVLSAALIGAAVYFGVVALREDRPPTAPPPKAPPVAETRPGRSLPVEAEDRMKISATESAPPIARPARAPDLLEGLVRDHTGTPLGDATVQFLTHRYVRDLNKRGDERFEEIVLAQTATAADGAFSMSAPPGWELQGRGILRALRPGYVAQYKDMIVFGSTITFTLEPGTPVRGRVLDRATEKPIAGVRIKGWLAKPDRDADRISRWTETAYSGPDGAFRFDGVPSGAVMFLLFHGEYLDRQEVHEIGGRSAVEVDFRLKRGLPVHVVVVDAVTRKPLPGAVVTAGPPVFAEFAPRRAGTADAEGRVRLEGMETGETSIVAVRSGYAKGTLFRPIEESDAYDPAKNNVLLLEMHPAASVSGVIRDAEGAPVAGAEVFLAELKSVFWTVRPGPTTSDAQGRYLLSDVEPGAKVKVAVRRRDPERFGQSEELTVGPGELRDGVDVVMPRGAGIDGRVTDTNGAPVAGAFVSLKRPPFFGLSFPGGEGAGSLDGAETDADGRFRFGGLWPGRHFVTVDHRDFVLADQQAAEITHADEIAPFEVKLERGGAISGRVFDADGAPAVGADVRAYSPLTNDAVAAATADAEGAFTLARLREGGYKIRARRPETHQSSPAVEDLRPGVSGVELRMVRNPSVAGAVIDQAGRVVTEFTVRLSPTQRRLSPRVAKSGPTGLATLERTFKDDGGLFLFDDVEPGHYVVDLAAPGYAPTRGPEFEASPQAPVTDLGPLTVRSGAALVGVVTDDRGAPAADVDVLLTRLGGTPIPELPPAKNAAGAEVRDANFVARTDASGRYRFAAVPHGQYLVRFE